MNCCVYKITNLINNKCYIGSTNNYLRRMREHRTYATCSPDRIGYEHPLYRSFRKHGLSQFKFEILIDNIDTLHEVRVLEEQLIKQYNSVVPNGYNIKASTEGLNEDDILSLIKKLGMKCALVDEDEKIIKIYNSLREAGRDNSISAECISKVCQGQQYHTKNKIFRYLNENNEIIEIIPSYSFTNLYEIAGISVENPNDIIFYSSIKETIEKEKISKTALHKCLKGDNRYSFSKGRIWRKSLNGEIIENEIPIQTVIDNYNKKYILFKDRRQTLSGWCKEFNLPYDKIKYQVKQKNRKIIDVFKEWGIE